jgi:antitoxin ParD1/3/4
MNVSLTPQLEALVTRKVTTGLYSSASEVVREALRLLDEHDRIREHRLAQLREEVAVGLKQLRDGKKVPGERVVEEMREKSRRLRRAKRT